MRKRVLIVLALVVLLAPGAYGLRIVVEHARLRSCDPRGVLAHPGRPAMPGVMGESPPWPRNCRDVRRRMAVSRIPPISLVHQSIHIHLHLDLYARGDEITVPKGIGLSKDYVPVSPLHTHAFDGLLHVESPVRRRYTLGQFFAVWGVRLSDRCMGGYCAGAGRALRAYIDGRPVDGSPAAIALRRHDEIVVSYGTTEEIERHLPASYDFAAGD